MTTCNTGCAEVNAWQEGCSSAEPADACDTKNGEQRFSALADQSLFQLTAFKYAPGTNSLQVHKNGLLVDPLNIVELTSTTFWIQGETVNAGDVVVATALTGVSAAVAISISNISIYSVALGDGQQLVAVPAVIPLDYSAIYISGLLTDNGRLVRDVDYTQDIVNSTITLTESYPEGTLLTLVYNDVGEGEGDWTPTKVNGAAFASATGKYTLVDNIVTAAFTVTFAVETDAADASIGGFPIAATGEFSGMNGLAVGENTSSTNVGGVLAESVMELTKVGAGGGSVTITEMSGATVSGVMTYFASN